MADKRKPSNLAWLVKPFDNYGQRMIRAEVVVVQPDGELHAPGDYRFDEGHEFASFQISAYLGWNIGLGTSPDKTAGQIWGLSHEFAPHTVKDAEHAASMLKVFRRVERGMQKAITDSGYVADGDYFSYFTRIATALGIRRYYVRNHRENYNMTGETFREADAPFLQHWLRRTSELAESKPGELMWRA
jgi:hypothetical protein